MSTSHAEIVAAAAACVAAGGASYAALLAGLIRRSEIRRQQAWDILEADRARALNRLERNSDWLREQRAITSRELIERLADLIALHDTELLPLYQETPIGPLDTAAARVRAVIAQIQKACVKANMVASANMMPAILDAAQVHPGVFTPRPRSAGAFPPLATRRIETELDAVATITMAIMTQTRLAILADDPSRLQVPARLPDRSCVGEDPARFLAAYAVRPLDTDPSYEADDDLLESLRDEYPHWTPDLRIDAVLIDEGEVAVGVRRSLDEADKTALLRRIAADIEIGTAPPWRDGHAPGSRIHIYP